MSASKHLCYHFLSVLHTLQSLNLVLHLLQAPTSPEASCELQRKETNFNIFSWYFPLGAGY
jgi:hypothetical protein